LALAALALVVLGAYDSYPLLTLWRCVSVRKTRLGWAMRVGELDYWDVVKKT